jgi:hypothetical protein
MVSPLDHAPTPFEDRLPPRDAVAFAEPALLNVLEHRARPDDLDPVRVEFAALASEVARPDRRVAVFELVIGAVDAVRDPDEVG